MPFGLWVHRALLLENDEMRRREENGQRQDDGERRERPQTEPVDDHRRVLPVARQLRALVVGAQPRRDRAQLADDRLEQRRGAVAGARRRPGALVARPDERRRRRRRRPPPVGACRTSDVVLVDRMLRQTTVT